MLKFIGIVTALVLVLLAGVLAYAATMPDTFRVQRTIMVRATPDKIFPLIDNLHAFNAWNPFEKKDPGKGTYSGPPIGPGAAYAWDSSQLGAGRMEITEATAPSKVVMKLDFIKPFEAHNIAEFTLVPKGDMTEVGWAMHGPMPFISKVISVFFSMDKMVGGDFEAGLASLKAMAEK